MSYKCSGLPDARRAENGGLSDNGCERGLRKLIVKALADNRSGAPYSTTMAKV